MQDRNFCRNTISQSLVLAIGICGFLFSALPAADHAYFCDLTPLQAASLIQQQGTNPRFVILDVRTPAEFAENRIHGAQNIDVQAADFKIRIVKLKRRSVYLVCCRGGVRSAKAMKQMRELGFKRVYNLAGGLKGWQAEKLPLENEVLK